MKLKYETRLEIHAAPNGAGLESILTVSSVRPPFVYSRSYTYIPTGGEISADSEEMMEQIEKIFSALFI